MVRTFGRIAVLLAAIGLPYWFSQQGSGDASSWLRWPSFTTSDSVADGEVEPFGESYTTVGYANNAHHQVEKLRGTDPSRYRYDADTARQLGALPGDSNADPQISGTPITDLREILRFDISPEWVFSRFSRVTTVLADTSLEGLRVPLVTGTRADDIAGSMTYYFDNNAKLQRLTIHGFTGDPSRLVDTAATHYGLSRSPSLEAGVYVSQWNGQAVHFLRLSHAPVVYADAVHQKYTVFLELNQPSLAFGISPEARRIITSDRGAVRW